jgi:hypothetical protein
MLVVALMLVPLVRAEVPFDYCAASPLDEVLNATQIEPVAEIHLQNSLQGLCSIHQLREGAVMFSAKMDIDADGSPNALSIDPEYGQLMTSYRYRGFHGQDAFVDAESVPYIVLPQPDRQNEEFYDRTRVGLGDIAAVIYRGHVEFAFVADLGPPEKIGEGSVALAQALGHDPFVLRDGQRLVDRPISRGVVYIVFPGSRLRGATPDNVLELLRENGKRLLAELTVDSSASRMTAE